MCGETTPVSLCSTTCDECDSRRDWLPPANHQAPNGLHNQCIQPREHCRLRQRRSASPPTHTPTPSPLRSGARRDARMRTDRTRCAAASVLCGLLGHRVLRRLKGKQSPGLSAHPRRRRRSRRTELAVMLAHTQPRICYYPPTRAGTVEVMVHERE